MEFQFSKRAQRIQEGIFSVLDHKKTELLAAGRKVYNFSVGTPDFSPQPHIMKAVAEAAMDRTGRSCCRPCRPFTGAGSGWSLRRRR